MLKKYAKDNLDIIAKYMVETANKYNVDIDILLAIAGTESNFSNDSSSISISEFYNISMVDNMDNFFNRWSN